ncbi:aldose 1-epimerase family protein [Telluribacter sp.]|jgi:galactose mutarotase-like enzyme|uniref:aldose 1-epimerase family protein n=1 Tax=Telluribacter sp. TaxID=1978767 RepID=UPI002E0E740A|nr:aldose 1-epimerase family protein [Telluribacter sp.]
MMMNRPAPYLSASTKPNLPMHTIENYLLRISVNEIGAELCRIQSVATGLDYIWKSDPAIWAYTAPVLFPIIGELKEGTYFYQGNSYHLARHGILRNNSKIKLTEKARNFLKFSLEYDEDTLLAYPFKFRFNLTFTLEGNRLLVKHEVANAGKDTMLFSVGGHPAFACPRHEGESYSDYYIEFDKKETVARWLLTDKGLLSGETEMVLQDADLLPLSHDIFNADALVFKDLKSRKASLKSRITREVVTLSFEDFPYLGIWAKPHGDFVCIEPWLGVADSQDTDQQFENKEGLISLEAGGLFTVGYSVEITEE